VASAALRFELGLTFLFSGRPVLSSGRAQRWIVRRIPRRRWLRSDQGLTIVIVPSLWGNVGTGAAYIE
jgi:hypothetical protein